MSFFNEKLIKVLFSRDYICDKCGAKMEFEDEWENTLVCTQCGYDIDIDRYGFESDEEYEALFPLQDDEEETYEDGETYDEVCGELDD